ncbi:MAG: hypothetical protein GX205_03990 [Firmicutes bacterium]|jgi:hypothetical protein|nr:hypothetical protein [Bacillota bacterium]
MRKKLASFVVCFLVLTLLVGAVPVAASSPFGPGAVPLTTDEMEEIDGEFSPVVTSVIAGSLVSTASYLITTPSSEWSFAGAVRNAIAGAVSGLVGYLIP